MCAPSGPSNGGASAELPRRVTPPEARSSQPSRSSVSSAGQARWNAASSAATSDTRRRTEVEQHAVGAARRTGDAHAPPVPDQQVREAPPVRAGHELAEIALDLDRVILLGQPEALREA